MRNLIVQSFVPPKINPKRQVFKNKWFDNECLKAREKSMELLKDFRKSQKSGDREIYIAQKNHYQHLCKIKQLEYYKQVERKLSYVSDRKSGLYRKRYGNKKIRSVAVYQLNIYETSSRPY